MEDYQECDEQVLKQPKKLKCLNLIPFGIFIFPITFPFHPYIYVFSLKEFEKKTPAYTFLYMTLYIN